MAPALLTADELCAQLAVDARQVRAWLQEGLPAQGRGRARRFDAAAVEAWLVARGLYRPRRIVQQIKDVARAFEVSQRSVQYWRDQGMPGAPGNYDLDAIDAWRKAQRGDEEQPLDETTKGYWATQKARLEAELLAEKLKIARGQNLPRDWVERFLCELIGEARNQFTRLPQRVAPLIPKVQRDKLIAEIERIVAEVLTTLSDWRLPEDEAAPAEEPADA